MKKKFVLVLILFIPIYNFFAQSTNCSTATSVALVNGNGCANGTTVGAISDNTFYGNCNPSPTTVNEVWYTYVTNGSVNDYTITPGTLTNTEFILYSGGCPGTPGAIMENCTTATGSSVLTTTWGFAPGVQVWIGIASVAGTEGTFQFCINSQPPAQNPGNTCALGIPLCDKNTFTKNPMNPNASGQTPNCFLNPAQRDIWYQFTITQAGILAWKATPIVSSTEFDWALWDITNGCPGTVACCNYNFANGSGNGFGMQNVSNNVPCGDNGFSPFLNAEFSPTMNVTCGKTYAIQISNYSNTNNGFTFDWTNSTALISSTASFTPSPTQVCGSSMTVNFNNTSTGTCPGEVWDFGDGTSTYSGTTPPSHTYSSPGTYAITANISGVCPSAAVQYVQLLAPLAATITSAPTGCSGTCTGSATLSNVSGGNGIFTYLWSNGATGSSISGLCPGTFSVTVSNAACGSSIIQTTSVGTSATIPNISFSTSNPACGSSNGSITATPTGGTTPYTYLWNTTPAQTSATATGLQAGNYTVTVTDANGCNNDSSLTIGTTPNLILNTSSDSVSCNGGNDGTATVTPSGGTTPYTYLWSNGGNQSTITNLSASTYNVTVSDNAGCQNSTTLTVNTPSVMVINATSTDVTCQGGNNGSAIVSASGGITPYSYLWDNGAGTQNIVSLQSNTYFVTVTDNNNCQKTTSVVVNDGAPTADATITQVGPFCNNDPAVTLTAATGGGTYSGTGVSGNSFSPASAGNGTFIISYSIAGSCGDTDTVSITVNAMPDATINPVPSLCTGGSAVTLTAASGGGTFSGTGVSGNSFDPAVSGAGNFTVTYNITVSGCSASDTETITVNQSLDATITPAGPFCTNDAPATLSAVSSGGTWSGTGMTGNSFSPPAAGAGTQIITYSISGACGDTDTVSIVVNAVPDATISPVSPLCTASSPVTLSAATSGGTWSGTGVSGSSFNPSVSGAGTFTVTYNITVSGCSSSDTESITVNQSLNADISPAGPFCSTSPPINLLAVSPGGIWTGNGITNNSSGTFDASVSGSGNHIITYSINSACGDTDTVTIIVSEVTINSNTITNSTCFGICDGSLSLNASGASQFSIDNGTTFQGGNIFSNLCSGSYSCIVQNSNGCADSVQLTINQPPILLINFLPVSATCFDSCNAYAVVIPSGGTTPYNYLWSPTGNSPPIGSGQGTASAGKLCDGTYNLLVTDSNGCTRDTNFIITEPTQGFVIATGNQTLCSGSCDGSATANAFGGATPFSFQWDNNAGSQTTQNATDLCAGTYLVTATDNNFCPVVASVIVSQPQPVIDSVSPGVKICIGSSTLITVTASGGTGPYTYTWDNNLPDGPYQQVNPGTETCYSVIATDFNGCQSLPQVSCITFFDSLKITTYSSMTICPGWEVELSAQVQGGDGLPYSYFWNSVPQAANINVYPPGGFPDTVWYIVEARDSCSPSVKDSVMITFFEIPDPDYISPEPLGCEPYTATFTNNITNASSCIWDMGDGTLIDNCATFQYTYYNQGNYIIDLTIVTTEGCQTTVSPASLISVKPNPIASFTYTPENPTVVNTLVNFTNASSGQITNWDWTFFNINNSVLSTSQNINPEITFPSDTGIYPVNLVVTTLNGCKDDTTIYIYINNEYSLWIPNSFTPNGDGENDFFPPKGIGINPERFVLYIFDRWGDMIFESHNLNDPWDGTAREIGGKEIVKQDVYVWKIVTEEATRERKEHRYVGHVTLLR